MSDQVLLVLAKKDGKLIAGALNFIGQDSLYGRNWGCVERIPNLHFETCYYQAIEFAIKKGLATVEAGAKGLHKAERHSNIHVLSHWLANPQFSEAVSYFLRQERAAVEEDARSIDAVSPYRRDNKAC